MGARTVVICIAIWSIIQGLAYATMAFLALLAHNCRVSMADAKLDYLMYIIFFRDRKCGHINWNLVADIPPAQEPIWPPVTDVAYRTNIIVLIYLVLSALMVVTSLMIIVGSFLSALGRFAYCVFFLPWALVLGVTVIFDVVAAGFFFYDLFNTLTMDAFLHHLQMENTASLYAPLQSFLINENILPIPAVILLCVAGRGFVIWCLNIIFIHVILARGKRILLAPRRSGSPLATSSFGFEQTSQNGPNALETHYPQSKERSRYSDPVPHQEQSKLKYQYDNMNYQQDNYDLSRNIGRRYMEPIKSEPVDDAKTKSSTRIQVNGNSSTLNSWNTTRVIPKGNFNRQQKSPQQLQQQPPPQQPQSQQQSQPPQSKFSNELANPWREMDDGTVLKIERPHFRLPNKPSLLKKLSDASYSTAAADDQQLHSPTTSHSTDELRSQLPWSYFHGRDEALPRKTFSQNYDQRM